MLHYAPIGRDLVSLLADVALLAEAEDDPRYDRIAELARQLAAALAALPPDPDRDRARARSTILGAIRDAHQPLREVVLWERSRGRGLDLSPEDFQALAEDLVARGQVRVSVDHESPARDPEPFEPRFYRPAE